MINTSFIKAKTIVFGLLFLLLIGCASTSQQPANNGGKYYHTFFAGVEGMQYFVRPMAFKGTDKAGELHLDITFRYKNEIKDSALINFSLYSPEIYKNLDSLTLARPGYTATADKIELLFNQKTKSGFESRFVTKVSLSQLKQWYESAEWEVILYQSQKAKQYQPNSSARKSLKYLRDQVFVIM